MHVPADRLVWWRPAELTDRDAERGVLDRLIEAVRDGESRSLVVYGEAGVGKTALLEYLATHAPGCRVVRAAGAQSEMELAFAGLHQVCAPMLDRVEHLPVPQRDALRTAFGMSAGPVPDRFLVGLAVLSLLSQVAEEQPLVCVLDDGQWLDHASAQILAFVARRLGAESVGLVFGCPGGDLTGLPELAVEGLREADARALLAAALTAPIDARVRDQIVTETRGNPLALLELPRGLTPEQLAGGFGLPGALALAGNIEQNFQRRVGALPDQTRRMLLLAAADPSGDPGLVWRAAARLGIGAEAAGPAAEGGLAEFGARLRFRHPLVRSAAYQSASAQERQEAHRALAEVTDPQLDPDRRAWHRAQAAPGPDEDVAAELERSASRAQARGGLAAAAAFLVRAAALTPDQSRRAERELGAAQAMLHAGAFEPAQDLLVAAQAGPLDQVGRARVELLLGRIAWAVDHGSEAPPLLLSAAKRLEPLDLTLARQTYLDAFIAAVTADRLTTGGGDALQVANAVRAAPLPPEPLGPVDQLLDGLAVLVTDGYAAATTRLHQSLSAFVADELPREVALRWIILASHTALVLWDHKLWQAICARQVDLIRDAGALSVLPYGHIARIFAHISAGELARATSLVEELGTVAEATRGSSPPQGAIALAASQGREAETLRLVKSNMPELLERGEGMGVSMAQWSLAVLYNGLGRYEEAVASAGQALADAQPLGLAGWARIELIEAAVRSGNLRLAADALEGFSERDRGTDWALGVDARSRALLRRGVAAEEAYREAIERLDRCGATALLARTRLVFGEWLRRERRPSEAREQLRTAHSMLETMGVAAFAERASRELRAAGGAVRKRTAAASREELTAQEAQIARLARDGLSNPEIGTRLFISARTVQYHLRKVFIKLDITSRSQLDSVLLRGPATIVQHPR